MSASVSKFPLESLRSVREIRLRKLETEMKACRERWAVAERRRIEATERWEQSLQHRENFAASSWREMLDKGSPTGAALNRHERHLALLDQVVRQLRTETETRTHECAAATEALDQAAAAWRRARSKLDALGEMKQEWLREAQSQQALREEHSLEELMLRRTTLR